MTARASGLTFDEAVEALRRGTPIVVPTDTVYGVAVSPSVEGAVDRLFDVKRRPREVHIAVLVADVDQARELVTLDERAERLGAAFWPGPLTMVLPEAPGAAVPVSTPGAGIGVRCPDHDLVRRLLVAVGPLATTSANLHGEPTPSTAIEAGAVLGVDHLDGGRIEGTASTVVDARPGELQILRAGPISLAELLAVE